MNVEKNDQAPDPSALTLGGRLRFLLRDSVVYGLAAAISRFASLLTFPIIVRHLTLADYGLFDMLQFLGSFLTVFLIFGQDSGVARYFFEYKDEPTRKEIISQSLMLRLYVSAVFLPVAFILGHFAAPRLGLGPGSQVALNILLLQVPFIVILNFCVVLLRVTFARTRFILLSVGFSFTQAAFWLLAILAFDASVAGILLAGLIASAAFAGIGLFFVRSWLKPTLRLNHVVQMMPYSLPYGAISSLRAVVPLVERSLVALLLTAEALGLFAAGAKIAMLFAIFAYAFQSAWEPFALSIGKRPDAQATYNMVLKTFVLFACLMVIGLTGIARPVLDLLATEKFAPAAVIIFPLMLALAIEAIGWITEIGIILERRSALKLLAFVLGTACGLLAILLLAPPYGLTGVAVAIVIGSTVKTVAVTILAGKVHDLRWDKATFVVFLPLTLLGGLATTYASHHHGLPAALTASAVTMLLLLISGYTLVLSADERAKLRLAIGKWRSGTRA